MKRTLLPFFLLIAGIGQAQSLTQANEPTVGETGSYHLCDSFANWYEGTTGSSVTWDYSDLPGYGTTRTLDVLNASSTANASDFGSSSLAFDTEGSFISYYNSSSTERTSQGFVYIEATLGTIVAKYSGNDELVMNYPFAYGDQLTDTYSGTLNYTYITPQSNPLSGNVLAQIDGQGTLLLNGSTFNNVIRYTLVDTSLVTGVLVLGDVELVKKQFEYYDPANAHLPLLVLSQFIIQQVGSSTPISEATIVLSSVAPLTQLGLTDESNEKFKVYPNPVKDVLIVDGEFGVDAVAVILDQSGRIVKNVELNNQATTNVSELNSGIYIVQVRENGLIYNQKIIID